MRRAVYALLLVVVLITGLTGCVTFDREQRRLARQLERRYTRVFRTYVRQQFGRNARLRNVNTETRTVSGPTPFRSTRYATRYLGGTVTIGNEVFEARFNTERNQLHSTRYADLILASAKEYYQFLGLDIFHVQFTSHSSMHQFQPAHVTTFEELRDSGGINGVILAVSSDIRGLSDRDFRSMPEFQRSLFTMRIFQMIETDDMARLSQLPRLDINNPHRVPQVHCREAGGSVDAFIRYRIIRSISVRHAGTNNSGGQGGVENNLRVVRIR